MAFKDSYTPALNMVGVAGAIIAQIALTALSLPNLDDTHWTARAASIMGLSRVRWRCSSLASCRARCPVLTMRMLCGGGRLDQRRRWETFSISRTRCAPQKVVFQSQRTQFSCKILQMARRNSLLCKKSSSRSEKIITSSITDHL